MTGAGRSHMPQQSQRSLQGMRSGTYYMCVLRTVHFYISQQDSCDTARCLTMVLARNCFAQAGYTTPPRSGCHMCTTSEGMGDVGGQSHTTPTD
jgi:hypothetical protein